MPGFKVVVIGGWCGNRMFMVADRLTDLLATAGYPCEVATHNVWENYSRPPAASLLLQLLPAFTEAEAGCPVLTIKPMIVDLDHAATLDRILKQVAAIYPR